MVGSLLPLHTILPLKYTLHSSPSYVTLHPASHEIAIKSSDVCVKPGTICTLVALSESHGMLILHVCVDLVILPSGGLIEIGLVVSNTLMTGVPDKAKYPEAPASITAISTAIFILPTLKQVAVLGKSRKLSSKIVLS